MRLKIENLSIEKINPQSKQWDETLKLFDDSNIYQTVAFGLNSGDGSKLENVVIKKNNEIISMAQIRLKTLPLVNKGIAYIRWAPLWQKRNQSPDVSILKTALEKLINEYVEKRKLVLRIMPKLTEHKELFEELNFHLLESNKPYRTFILDIQNSLEDIRKGFRKKWRYSLKQAEKSGLQIESGESLEYFDTFLELYKSMHTRKQFKEFVDVKTFRDIQQLLLPGNKLRIFIAYLHNQPLASIVISAMGDTGIYLLGGSNETALKYSASYLLQWKAIEWLKENNIKYYDLGGIDPETNPGVYTFKKGLGGEDISFIGTFELSGGILSKTIVKLGEKVKKLS